MNISELKEGSVFLDTNILLYAYTNTQFLSVMRNTSRNDAG